MQDFPSDLPEDQTRAYSGKWSLGGVWREVTCIHGLSKRPGSFHGDVAFPTGAELTEFHCRGVAKLREGRDVPPFPSPLCHTAELTLRIWDP